LICEFNVEGLEIIGAKLWVEKVSAWQTTAIYTDWHACESLGSLFHIFKEPNVTRKLISTVNMKKGPSQSHKT
jgi:hypothetical protein